MSYPGAPTMSSQPPPPRPQNQPTGPGRATSLSTSSPVECPTAPSSFSPSIPPPPTSTFGSAASASVPARVPSAAAGAGSIANDGIFVVRAETGKGYLVSVNPTGPIHFQSIKVTIAAAVGVPDCNQVLLGVNGTKIDASTIGAYLMSGNSEIFLYDNRNAFPQFSPVPFRLNAPPQPQYSNMDRVSRLRLNLEYNLSFGKEVQKVVVDRIICCTEWKTEMENQHRAISAAVQSAHDYVKTVKRAYNKIASTAREERERAEALLASFPSDMNKIRSIPVPDFLHSVGEGKYLGHFVSEEKLQKKHQDCISIHGKFKEQLDLMETRTSECLQTAETLSLNPMNALELDESISKLEKICKDVETHCSALDEDLRTFTEKDLWSSVDPYTNIEERQRYHLQLLSQCEGNSEALWEQIAKFKECSTRLAFMNLKSCAAVGSLGAKASYLIHIIHHGIPNVRESFDILQLVHDMPKAFEEYISEVRTRNVFKTRVTLDYTKFNEILRQKREQEMTRRTDFRSKYLTHLPQQLQPGVQPELPLLEANVPMFDAALPELYIPEDSLPPPLFSEGVNDKIVQEKDNKIHEWQQKYSSQEVVISSLQNDISSLKRQAEQEKSRINILQQLVGDKEMQISQLQLEGKRTKEKEVLLQQEMENNKLEIEKSKRELESTTQQLKEEQNKAKREAEGKKEIANLLLTEKQTVLRLQKELETAQAANSHSKTEVDLLKTRDMQLNAACKEKDKAAQELERTLRNEKARCMALQQDLEKIKTREDAMKGERTELQTRITQLQKDLAAAKSQELEARRITDIEKVKNSTLSEELEQTRKNFQAEKTSRCGVERELEQTKEREMRFMIQLHEERERVVKLQQDLNQNTQQRTECEKIRQSQTQTLQDLEEEKDQVNRLNKRIYDLQEILEREKVKCAQCLKEERAKTEEALKKVEISMQLVQTVKTEKDSEIQMIEDKYKSAIAAMKAELHNSQENVQHALEENESETEDLQLLRRQKATVEEQLRTERNNVHLLQAETKKATETQTQLSESLRRTSEQLVALQLEINTKGEYQKMYEEMRQRYQDTQQQCAVLHRALGDCHAQNLRQQMATTVPLGGVENGRFCFLIRSASLIRAVAPSPENVYYLSPESQALYRGEKSDFFIGLVVEVRLANERDVHADSRFRVDGKRVFVLTVSLS
ncbi:autophagy-related protein 11 [Pelomyxa schiedti]|nr:autophagy-related protein 11 [Pelomyxa schiedti]